LAGSAPCVIRDSCLALGMSGFLNGNHPHASPTGESRSADCRVRPNLLTASHRREGREDGCWADWRQMQIIGAQYRVTAITNRRRGIQHQNILFSWLNGPRRKGQARNLGKRGVADDLGGNPGNRHSGRGQLSSSHSTSYLDALAQAASCQVDGAPKAAIRLALWKRSRFRSRPLAKVDCLGLAMERYT